MPEKNFVATAQTHLDISVCFRVIEADDAAMLGTKFFCEPENAQLGRRGTQMGGEPIPVRLTESHEAAKNRLVRPFHMYIVLCAAKHRDEPETILRVRQTKDSPV